MARNYRAEYARRVQGRQEEARSLGITLTTRQAVGHKKEGLTGADVRNMYDIKFGQSAKTIDRAAKRMQAKWAGDRSNLPKRRDIPNTIKLALGENWDQIIYGGYA